MMRLGAKALISSYSARVCSRVSVPPVPPVLPGVDGGVLPLPSVGRVPSLAPGGGVAGGAFVGVGVGVAPAGGPVDGPVEGPVPPPGVCAWFSGRQVPVGAGTWAAAAAGQANASRRVNRQRGRM